MARQVSLASLGHRVLVVLLAYRAHPDRWGLKDCLGCKAQSGSKVNVVALVYPASWDPLETVEQAYLD